MANKDARVYKTLMEMKAVADLIMNKTYVGGAWNVDKRERDYPLMVIDNQVRNHLYQSGLLTLNLNLYLVDINQEKLQEDPDDYIIQLQSDMLNIASDYINFFEDNDDYTFTFQKKNGISFNIFEDTWVDDVAGVKFELQVRVPDSGDQCDNIFTNKIT